MDEPKRVVQLDYAPPRKRAVPVWAWVLIGLAILVVMWFASSWPSDSYEPAQPFPPGGNATGSAPAGR